MIMHCMHFTLNFSCTSFRWNLELNLICGCARECMRIGFSAWLSCPWFHGLRRDLYVLKWFASFSFFQNLPLKRISQQIISFFFAEVDTWRHDRHGLIPCATNCQFVWVAKGKGRQHATQRNEDACRETRKTCRFLSSKLERLPNHGIVVLRVL